jgi:hypothetical protein
MTVVLIANNLDSLGVSFLIKASATQIAREHARTIPYCDNPVQREFPQAELFQQPFLRCSCPFVRNAKTETKDRYEIGHQTEPWYMKSSSTVNLRPGQKYRRHGGLHAFPQKQLINPERMVMVQRTKPAALAYAGLALGRQHAG